MIEFNEKDFQLASIRKESKLFNLQTKSAFRVYGLRKTRNPLVHLSYNYDVVEDEFDEKLDKLVEFFKHNEIQFQWDSGSGVAKVCIGLRRDLRDHTILASSILQTIVYCLESRLDVNPSYKIKGVPRFPKY